jgi:molecular chaperone GrpE (heat shock protein)
VVPQTKAGIEAVGKALDEEGILHTPSQTERIFVAVMRAIGYQQMLEALEAADKIAEISNELPEQEDYLGRLYAAIEAYQRRQIR